MPLYLNLQGVLIRKMPKDVHEILKFSEIHIKYKQKYLTNAKHSTNIDKR